jgi:pyrophosphatase PpaX
MKYKNLLFDWDGCLAKTLELWLAAYKSTLKELQINKSDFEITSVFGDWQGGSKLGAPDNDKFFERVDDIVRERMVKVDLHDGVKSVLRKLKDKGFTQVVLSSSLREYLNPAMEYHGIMDLFEFVVTGEDVKKHKPDPEVINYAVKKLGGPKSGYIMIGDSNKDMFAARNADIDSILYYTEEHKLFYDLNSLLESQPTFVANNFDEIYEFLAKQ